MLEDKEKLLLEKVRTDSKMNVVKEVSVHAAVNDDGHNIFSVNSCLKKIIVDELEMKLLWEKVELSPCFEGHAEVTEKLVQTVNMRNKKVILWIKYTFQMRLFRIGGDVCF